MPLSPRRVHQLAHPQHGGGQPGEDCLANQVVPDVELGELRDRGDRLDVVVSQAVADVNFDPARMAVDIQCTASKITADFYRSHIAQMREGAFQLFGPRSGDRELIRPPGRTAIRTETQTAFPRKTEQSC